MAKLENAANPAKKDTVTIRLPLTKTERDDVLVGLNGKMYQIQRGHSVEVPRGVAEILENSEQMMMNSINFELQVSNK